MKLMKVNRGYYNPSISNFFDNWFDRDLTNFRGQDMAQTMSAVNVLETKDGFELELAAPGFSKDNIKVDVDKDVLTISAEMSQENSSDDDIYTRREYSISSFNRSFTLPETVEGDKIGANYKDGILKVSIPKKEEAKLKAKRLVKVS